MFWAVLFSLYISTLIHKHYCWLFSNSQGAKARQVLWDSQWGTLSQVRCKLACSKCLHTSVACWLPNWKTEYDSSEVKSGEGLKGKIVWNRKWKERLCTLHSTKTQRGARTRTHTHTHTGAWIWKTAEWLTGMYSTPKDAYITKPGAYT